MRKLTDIISGMDQYNGVGSYTDEYKNGDKVEIETEFPNPPESAIIPESLENDFRNILGLETLTEITGPVLKKETDKAKVLEGPVLSFDRFVAERKYLNQPSNIQSYFGGIDDDNDDEFLEEE